MSARAPTPLERAARHRERESAASPTQRAPRAGHRERWPRGPTHRDGPQHTKRWSPTQAARLPWRPTHRERQGPDTEQQESGGVQHRARHRERRVPTQGAPGPDAAESERVPGPKQRAPDPNTETAPGTESAGHRHSALWESGARHRSRHRERESAGPRHRQRRAPTQSALGPDTESAADRERRPDTETAGARHRVRWGLTQRLLSPDTKCRAPTQRARPDTDSAGPDAESREPDSESAGPRHGERRAPTQATPGERPVTEPDTEERRGPTQRAPRPDTDNERVRGPDTESAQSTACVPLTGCLVVCGWAASSLCPPL